MGPAEPSSQVEALQLYGGPRQRVLVFVAMKKQCDARCPKPTSISKPWLTSELQACSCCGSQMVMRMLRKYQISANTMHSDKDGQHCCRRMLPGARSLGHLLIGLNSSTRQDQQQREEALQQFKTGETSVLIATDVAARGLDIKGGGGEMSEGCLVPRVKARSIGGGVTLAGSSRALEFKISLQKTQRFKVINYDSANSTEDHVHRIGP